MLKPFWLFIPMGVNSLVAADLSGAWTGTLRTDRDESQVCLSLSQHDQEITGDIAYENDNKYAEITSRSLKADRVEFEVNDHDHGIIRFSLVVFDDDRLMGVERIANRFATVELSKYRPMLRRGVDAGLPIQTLLHSVQPEYTKEARTAGIHGAVTLEVEILTTGVVGPDVKVVRGLGFGLDEKAVECVKKWRFTLPRWDCQPVRSRSRLVVNFKL